jgi:hypothetical protein
VLEPPAVFFPVGGVVQKLRSFEANQRMPLTLALPCAHPAMSAYSNICLTILNRYNSHPLFRLLSSTVEGPARALCSYRCLMSVAKQRLEKSGQYQVQQTVISMLVFHNM